MRSFASFSLSSLACGVEFSEGTEVELRAAGRLALNQLGLPIVPSFSSYNSRDEVREINR